ncbi:helix-turn-helix domain-containing protein [Nonomuraea wenchangensis]|uniref:Helix-turn-helix n=1 Tax=Nonomuraea wenchangensis TaxID=568860 RepID=A0A1I0ETQ4_9ACTN|nr:helix-turn-helix transcriptional regulator [Nonomuraea wenchangensis]SET48790.1 Helix-turn-helix [Nonomuraea wenchangensis]
MAVRLEHVIARNMAELREQQGWTQADLARQMCAQGARWTPNRVTQLETLRRPVSLMEIVLLATVFGVPVVRLLFGDDLVEMPSGEEIPLDRFREGFQPSRREDADA